MKNIEELLNKGQLEAVKHKDGPLLILAGAGSGKTRVITYRVAYLISEYGIPPENILAVTFTNKAADEMKARIKSVVGKKAEKIFIGTFHSFGCMLLRNYAEKIGYTKNFTIYDEDDRERLVKECMAEINISEKTIKPFVIVNYIQDNKDKLITPEEYKKNYILGHPTDIVAKIYLIYEEKLKRNNAMDFDDLIIKPIEIFEKNKDVLEKIQDRFRYILIDEYQDINNSQYVLISMIARKYQNICVVGDDDQSIYKFRGADITNILSFEDDYPNAKVIKLEQNYRSTKNILKAAYCVIRNNKSRKEKELWTENEEGEKITFYYANDEIEEAEYVAEQIFNLIQVKNLELKDIAVFYRTNAQSRIIEDKLRRNGIPYRLVGGIQFYSRMEIKDLLAYLRIISNPYDILSFKRIINVPPRGIGDATIEKIQNYAFKNNLKIYDALFEVEKIEEIKDTQKNSIIKLREFIKELNEKKEKITLTDLIKEIINKTGYLQFWESDNSPESKDRIENIKEFVSAISEFEENKKGKLEDFLHQVSLISEIDRWDKNANAVTLMTIHSAKGLEFDTVFVIGMDEEIFPHKNSFDEEEGIEEERRLCYVSITRAKRKLFLISALARRQYGNKKIMNISRFLKEIDKNLLKIEGRTPVAFLEKPKEINLSFENEYIDENLNKYEDNYEFIPGQKVRHLKMGKGIIEKVEPWGDDLRLTVIFEDKGKKVLSAKYAKLKKIE